MVVVKGESCNAREKGVVVTEKVFPIPIPPSPFPQRLAKKIKERKYHRFITMLKQLSINILLILLWRKFLGMLSL